MSLPSPLEKGDHEVVDEVCIETTFPSPPLRVPSPKRGLGFVTLHMFWLCAMVREAEIALAIALTPFNSPSPAELDASSKEGVVK